LISSGTGFFISNEGHIITNHHVIDKSDLNNVRKKILNYLMFELNKKMPEKDFESKYNSIYSDLKNLTEKSEHFYRVIVENKDNHIAEIIKSNSSLDLALIKIKGEKFNFLPLGDIENVNMTDQVIAVGYPIQKSLSFLKELRATVSIGNVSSIRDSIDGIQHTAAINPGNSGGPLLNSDGLVIGINAKTMTNAQGIHFAIPVDKLKKWLNEEKYSSILETNKNAAKHKSFKIDSNKFNVVKADKNETIEIGQNIFINYNAGADIYINGEIYGQTPLLMKSAKLDISVIRVETNEGYDEIKVKINPSITDIFTFNPVIKAFTGKLFIDTEPAKSLVYIDGKDAGRTPYLNQELSVGKHKIELKNENYKMLTDEVEISKNQLIEKKYTLEKTYLVKFKNLLPSNTKIELANGNNKISYNLNKPVRVEKGNWEVYIINEFLDTGSNPINIEITDDDYTIDNKIIYKAGELVIKNIKPKSIVYLDGDNITQELKNNKIKLNYGEHKLKVTNFKYSNIEKTFVLKNETHEINLTFTNDPNYFINSFKPIGVGLAAPGAVFTILGCALFSASIIDYYAKDRDNLLNYSDYDAYLKQRNTSMGIFWSGMGIAITGAAAIGASIPMFIIEKPRSYYFNKGKKADIKASLNINYSKDLNLSVSLKM